MAVLGSVGVPVRISGALGSCVCCPGRAGSLAGSMAGGWGGILSTSRPDLPVARSEFFATCILRTGKTFVISRGLVMSAGCIVFCKVTDHTVLYRSRHIFIAMLQFCESE